VTLAVEDGKKLKLKVVSKPQYADSKGKQNRSYTEVDSISADFTKSQITVELPTKKWKGYTDSKEYTITVSNKFDTAGATATVTTSDGNNNPPPVATGDNVDLYSGQSTYYIDVLANRSNSPSVVFTGSGSDFDSASGNMTIILPFKTSNEGGSLSVDRTTNTVKYVRAKDLFCNFTDWFEYSIQDSAGNKSGTVRVNISGKLNP
jgi:hypothetical protein